MNRNPVSVIAGGFGSGSGAPGGDGRRIEPAGEVTSISAVDTADPLRATRRTSSSCGYGMAVAQAQHVVCEIVNVLRTGRRRAPRHPPGGRPHARPHERPAGRGQGSHDIVLEMDEINGTPETDVAIVIGANDIRNPAAQEDLAARIAGMPVLEVGRARPRSSKRSIFRLRRVDNPLFYKENNRMLFGDARKMLDEVLGALSASKQHGRICVPGLRVAAAPVVKPARPERRWLQLTMGSARTIVRPTWRVRSGKRCSADFVALVSR